MPGDSAPFPLTRIRSENLLHYSAAEVQLLFGRPRQQAIPSEPQQAITQVIQEAIPQALQKAITQILQKAITQVLQKAITQVLQKAITQVLQKAITQVLQKAITQELQQAFTQGTLRSLTMKPLCKSALLTTILTAAIFILAAFVPQASAQTLAPGQPVLLGTTGSCKNVNQGGPCTETSTLVQIDPSNGALVRVIGPVGYTVNGMAWDPATDKLYATTAIGDVAFHGLIIIDPNTGQGTPVNPLLHNFGLAGADSPIHSVTIDSKGNRMVAWYDEFPPPQGVTDTFVTIDKTTGVATEFNNTGINTSQNGLAFDKKDLLWNIDSPKFQPDGSITQTAYQLDPTNGQPVHEQLLTPPIVAALGDFDPVHKTYYGLNFEVFNPGTTLVAVDLKRGTVATVGTTVDNLHTLAFVRHLP